MVQQTTSVSPPSTSTTDALKQSVSAAIGPLLSVVMDSFLAVLIVWKTPDQTERHAFGSASEDDRRRCALALDWLACVEAADGPDDGRFAVDDWMFYRAPDSDAQNRWTYQAHRCGDPIQAIAEIPPGVRPSDWVKMLTEVDVFAEPDEPKIIVVDFADIPF